MQDHLINAIKSEARQFAAELGLKFAYFPARTYYGHNPVVYGGVTIAYIENGATVEFSTAVCSDKDIFTRKDGRVFASQRFMDGFTCKVSKEYFKRYMLAEA
jgi:hypothetical protein